MKKWLAFIVLVGSLGFNQLSAQAYGDSPVKKIIDNPNSPELAQWIMEASAIQAQQAGSFKIESVKQRNLYTVMIMSGQLVARMQPLPLTELQSDFLYFLKNPNGDPSLSDSIDSSTPFTGQLYISEGLALVQLNPNDLPSYLPAIQSIALALNQYRSIVAFKAFKVDYSMVPDLGKSVIDQYFNTKLIFAPETAVGTVPPTPPSAPSIPEGMEEDEEVEAPVEGEAPSTPREAEAPTTGFPGLPDLGDMGDLEKAAEKLKDILMKDSKQKVDSSQVQEPTPSPDIPRPGSSSPAPPANPLPEGVSSEVFDFSVVDRAPAMKGCESAPSDDENKYCFEQALNRYAETHFVYPEHLKGSSVMGRVYLNLEFDSEGYLAKRQVVRGVDPDVDYAARMAFKDLPKMSPAEIHGKPVAMKYVLVLAVKE